MENLFLDDGGERIVLPDNPIDTVDGGDVSGGSTTNMTAQAAEQIEEFLAEGGGRLFICSGEHFIAGSLILHKFTAGTPNTSIVYVALGDGQGNGGGHGEWDSAVAVYYAGAAQSVSPDGSTAGYRFHNGFISTDVSTGNQPVDAFLTNLAYSGTVYVALKLTDAVANAEDRPDKIRGRYKCRRFFDFDATGRQLSATNSYTTNPARFAADRVLAYYEHKTPNDAALALSRLQDKIDWESWKLWRDFNEQLISWDNGTSVVNIPRFEAHIALTDDIILARVLDQICAASGTDWHDDGEKIFFLPPTERDPVHHFHENNIVSGSIRIEQRDLRDRPNYFTLEYRDFDDTFLGLTSTEVRREALKVQVGEIKTSRTLPNMRKSQADRLGERMARLEADNPFICALTGDETSIDVLQGDFVTVSHQVAGWAYQRCLVLSVELESDEDGIDTCKFTLQKIDDALYSDTAHGPRQEQLTP